MPSRCTGLLSRLARGAALLTLLAAPFSADAQRRVVVANDEWTLDDCCRSAGTADGNAFALNVRSWLTGGSAGQLLAYSNMSPGLLGDGLAALMETGGYTWTRSSNPAALTNLGQYRAIFVTGNPGIDNTALINYVLGGGSVFLMGGSGNLGGAGEANQWKTFLNRFGLEFEQAYNGISGNIDVSAFDAQGPFGAALFTDVDELFQNNGNTVLSAAATPDDVQRQLFVDGQRRGLYAAAQISAVPEPSTYLLLATGLGTLGLIARRRRA